MQSTLLRGNINDRNIIIIKYWEKFIRKFFGIINRHNRTS
ncbi:hypothetical protein ECDEC2B_2421 [Escherichia coli DEC2B]|uniref:Uncharacterized protein n=1 Tax=Escherichia coli DEC2D TaxID=868141 RepID=A0A828U4J5_ECOLX|nr:hypothetical protein ECDEC2B_2421 [Escherichia coli DEC2B]EHU45164.1 hypothetical protein ECDEC2D_2363 [Escherichia coli DEC2D]